MSLINGRNDGTNADCGIILYEHARCVWGGDRASGDVEEIHTQLKGPGLLFKSLKSTYGIEYGRFG